MEYDYGGGKVLHLSLKGERSWHCQAANMLRYLRGVCGRGVVSTGKELYPASEKFPQSAESGKLRLD
jgi:hypothetical protein